MPQIAGCKLLSIALLLSGCSVRNVNCDVQSVFKTIGDVGRSVVRGTIDLLPEPKGLFEASKQVLAGYPFEFVSSAINSICSTALASRVIRPRYLPDINVMQFQLISACSRRNFPLLDADRMWSSPEFDASKKVVIFVTGWATNVYDSEAVEVFAKAYACRDDANFVVLDAAEFVSTLYTWSAFNTEEIGRLIAIGLERLRKIVPVENIHLIGHSLGAHIVGAAGRYFQMSTGESIPRITGLDPAKPCFNEGERLTGLQRGDAAFIDVIHSNAGVLGKRESVGDMDFYPGGLNALQPGCLTHFCSHARAWQYFAETVYPGNEYVFLAQRCNALKRLRDDRCSGELQPMGYAAPTNRSGNYFLDVHVVGPFGQFMQYASETEFIAAMRCGECIADDVGDDV